MKRLEQMNILVESLGAEEALYALTKAMSDDEFNENYEYICRMYEINTEEEEEEEE